MKVGWIGVGHMGKPMAMNVLAGGFDMKVHDLNRNAATDLLEGGAEWAGSPMEALVHARDAAGPRGLVLATGSLFLAAEVREAALGIEPEIYPTLAKKAD